MDDVDAARALTYRLLGHSLAEPPTAELLARMARLGGEGALGAALGTLSALAAGTDEAAARTEYDLLFIGVARGELLPYASFYLTGFLHERPLARVRADLPALGLVRAPGRSDPEDHIAFLCEVMASVIEHGPPEAEARFFARHLAPWAGTFFTELEGAGSARLFRPIGMIGRLLIELDRQGFAYAQHDPAHRNDTEHRGAA